jgi:TRAP-type C4-dicarboxylate transport system substrate-binding protein
VADEAEAYQKQLADKKIPKIKEMFNAVGLKIVDEPDKPSQEAQTERKKKSTAKAKEREIDPAIFYSNTTDFCYDF